MDKISMDLDRSSKRPLYLQLYDHIKKGILSGELPHSEKLPSLRKLSRSSGLSLTTVEQAYDQLVMEGYITSRPQSGYYINEIFYSEHRMIQISSRRVPAIRDYEQNFSVNAAISVDKRYLYDMECFDFNKWKKCMNRVFNEQMPQLLFESDVRGELSLRREISKYLYGARGVLSHPDQIVISAGTQQITGHLALILQMTGINHVTVEEPGYMPVKSIFRDRGFLMTSVAISSDGIDIYKLPSNIRSAVYVSPSNQFPTGSVMPIAKRYELLDWAEKNDSVIIEDDYDSELRYFGRPVPALQGLRENANVVYLGSFSSTLFSSIKISYMVLPSGMVNIFESIRDDYTQTCSKAEQLTLASFMQQGHYETGIRKLRNLYSQKLDRALSVFEQYGRDIVNPVNTSSGLNMLVKVHSGASSQMLCDTAAKLGIRRTTTGEYREETYIKKQASTKMCEHFLIIYYNMIPLEDIEHTLKMLIGKWRRLDS